MSLPNYVNKDDLTNRLAEKTRFFHDYKIPIGVRKIDANWCEVFQYANISGCECFTQLLKVRLNDTQLSSFRELLEEFCANWGIIYVNNTGGKL